MYPVQFQGKINFPCAQRWGGNFSSWVKRGSRLISADQESPQSARGKWRSVCCHNIQQQITNSARFFILPEHEGILRCSFICVTEEIWLYIYIHLREQLGNQNAHFSQHSRVPPTHTASSTSVITIKYHYTTFGRIGKFSCCMLLITGEVSPVE